MFEKYASEVMGRCLRLQWVNWSTNQVVANKSNLTAVNVTTILGIILRMYPVNERWCYNITSSIIGQVYNKMIPAELNIIHTIEKAQEILFEIYQ